jgi:hypothetical protein
MGSKSMWGTVLTAANFLPTLINDSTCLFICKQNVQTFLNINLQMYPESIPWEATSHSATREFLNFFGTQRFITMFTRALHWSLSCDRWIQSMPPHSVSQRPILISSRLCLFFPSGFPIKNLICIYLSPCMLHVLPISSSVPQPF